VPTTDNLNNEAIRSAEKAAINRQTLLEEQAHAYKRLSELSNGIYSEYTLSINQMEHTAASLLSSFAAYGHGMLLRCVYPTDLPVVSYEKYAASILDRHHSTWSAMNSLLNKMKEVKSHETF